MLLDKFDLAYGSKERTAVGNGQMMMINLSMMHVGHASGYYTAHNHNTRILYGLVTEYNSSQTHCSSG